MNNSTQKYFTNLFKRKKRILALYTFIVFMAYPFLLITNLITNDGKSLIDITQTMLVLCELALAALAIILPLFTFKFAFVKKNVDTYFAIPLNRNHLFKAHFIAPILGTIIPILASYLLGGLFLIPDSGFDGYLILLLALLLVFIIFIVIYSMNTFIILKCNNIIDASIITAAIGIVPLMLYGALEAFLRSQVFNNGMLDFINHKGPQLIIDLFSPYRGLVLVNEYVKFRGNNIQLDTLDIVLFMYYVVIGILLIIEAKKSFKFKKGEDAEQLTTHYLTYPLLTNLGLIALILNFNFTDYDITEMVIILIALFVAYMIIHAIAMRSFKINMKMILKFIILIVAVHAFNIVSKETEFFGINRNVIDYKQFEEVKFDLQFYNYENDESTSYNVTINTNETLTKEEQELFEYIKEIQKEKSIAFKNDDHDALYPNDINNGDVTLNIHYDKIADSGDYKTNDEFVYYQLSEEQAKYIEEILNKIEGK